MVEGKEVMNLELQVSAPKAVEEEDEKDEDEKNENDTLQGDPEACEDQIISLIGETGRWQLERIGIVFLVSIPGLAHIFMSPFAMPKTDFWCVETESSGVHVHQDNLTKNECLDSCTSFEYDLSFWEETIISDYNLVCEASPLSTMAKMMFFGGFGIGTFVAGMVSDTFGRQKAICGFTALLLVSGVACSFMPSYTTFVGLWIVVGIAAIANFTVAFVWVMELASGKWKILLGMGMQFTWPISRIFILVCAWTLRNWRRMMQAVSAPLCLAPVLLYFLPESPRWLVAKGRISEAKVLIADAIKTNKRKADPEMISLKRPQQQRRNGTVVDILRFPVLRQKTLIMYFNWFASSFMMYGLSLNWQNLTGDLFLTFLIASCLDFPAKAFSVISLLFYGRKLPYIGLTFIAGILFVIILVVPKAGNDTIILVLSLIASFCVSSSFGMLWMWMSELMPTTVRNAGVGSASMIARVGGVLATTVGKLADVSPSIPISMFAFSALLSASLSILLPETQGKPLPDTPEESEKDKLLGIKDGFRTMFSHVRTRRAE
ncbi:organic cation transporter protein [Eurytemora carolleeae]|uniref:organic cation transporter protein n=1 Tax=Eurytemora carolleeae TaxID=1294199 RepID=UPI000C76E1AC|nr:organic cation transporter protein [Eurytemora carolleeae]|eukprot:XP_023332421.1 organic cation transporter protein-like [Eurytemora affinis]